MRAAAIAALAARRAMHSAARCSIRSPRRSSFRLPGCPASALRAASLSSEWAFAQNTASSCPMCTAVWPQSFWCLPQTAQPACKARSFRKANMRSVMIAPIPPDQRRQRSDCIIVSGHFEVCPDHGRPPRAFHRPNEYSTLLGGPRPHLAELRRSLAELKPSSVKLGRFRANCGRRWSTPDQGLVNVGPMFCRIPAEFGRCQAKICRIGATFGRSCLNWCRPVSRPCKLWTLPGRSLRKSNDGGRLRNSKPDRATCNQGQAEHNYFGAASKPTRRCSG